MVGTPSVILQDLVVEDGDDAYNTVAEVAALISAAPSGVFTRIWQKTVDAQTVARWGYGDPRLPDNQGYLTFAAGVGGASGAFEEGILQFVVENAPGTARRFQGRVASMRAHSADAPDAANEVVDQALFNNRQQMPPFPMGDGEAIMDSRLVLEWRKVKDAGAAVDSVAFILPSTLYA